VCGERAAFKRWSVKALISVVGDVTVARRYHYCRSCRLGFVPMDAWAGLDETCLTPRGRQLVVLAGSDQSFDQASDRLRRMCGVRVSDQTVRRACQTSGRRAKAYLEQSRTAADVVTQAEGQIECSLDGAKVNTTAGWREIRAVMMCKRQPGESAGLRQWDRRFLPEPEASWAWAAIADAEQTGQQLRSMADRLKLDHGQGVSALADGAPWIWKQCQHHLPEHEGTLDVYHLLEHLHATGRAIHGEGADAERWAEKQRAALFRDGPRRYLLKHLLPLVRTERRTHPASPAAEALRRLLGYLWPHRGRMAYRDRLRRGLPIGSGQIEGVCKNTLNRRLRLNNARWQPPNVDTMAALRCLHHSHQWDTFWSNSNHAAA